ncbi:hypothetical protein N8714_00875 [Rhodobacteraceae bacterium]|nr:hypothetical protein [Paracoccaceae bacterium]|tara:strand:- start:458 stop:646 length:189 start_codon:yes stop_codon:yes gene_type:complete
MKHEVINNPSTQNVLKMFFECRTFNENSEEKGVTNLEALINVEEKQIDFSKETNKIIRPLPI